MLGLCLRIVSRCPQNSVLSHSVTFFLWIFWNSGEGGPASSLATADTPHSVIIRQRFLPMKPRDIRLIRTCRGSTCSAVIDFILLTLH